MDVYFPTPFPPETRILMFHVQDRYRKARDGYIYYNKSKVRATISWALNVF